MTITGSGRVTRPPKVLYTGTDPVPAKKRRPKKKKIVVVKKSGPGAKVFAAPVITPLKSSYDTSPMEDDVVSINDIKVSSSSSPVRLPEGPSTPFPQDVRQAPKVVTVISDPKPLDILCERGGKSNLHPGNNIYRSMGRALVPLVKETGSLDTKSRGRYTHQVALLSVLSLVGCRFLEVGRLLDDNVFEKGASKSSKKAKAADRSNHTVYAVVNDPRYVMEKTRQYFRDNLRDKAKHRHRAIDDLFSVTEAWKTIVEAQDDTFSAESARIWKLALTKLVAKAAREVKKDNKEEQGLLDDANEALKLVPRGRPLSSQSQEVIIASVNGGATGTSTRAQYAGADPSLIITSQTKKRTRQKKSKVNKKSSTRVGGISISSSSSSWSVSSSSSGGSSSSSNRSARGSQSAKQRAPSICSPPSFSSIPPNEVYTGFNEDVEAAGNLLQLVGTPAGMMESVGSVDAVGDVRGELINGVKGVTIECNNDGPAQSFEAQHVPPPPPNLVRHVFTFEGYDSEEGGAEDVEKVISVESSLGEEESEEEGLMLDGWRIFG
ncbi:hypothetical protein TrCOL_g11496 [Triparma columacea]|nr:hypothetical protein TrCOL_g11496 [Triparma columacea]